MVVDVLDVLDVQAGRASPGRAVDLDPIGGPIGVALAEELGGRAVLVTPDHIAGNELRARRPGAGQRPAAAGGGDDRAPHRAPRASKQDGVMFEDRFDGGAGELPAAAVIDCGYRLPDESLWAELHVDPTVRVQRVGDCVAPRTIHEAILEGRRAAIVLG